MAVTEAVSTGMELHVRYDGRTETVPLAQLDLTGAASDQAIKDAAAAFFDKPRGAYDALVVTRTETAVILRPEAVYGA